MICDDIMTMPGSSRIRSTTQLDPVNGKIVGLY